MSDNSVGQWIPQVTHTFHWNTQEMEPTQSGLYVHTWGQRKGHCLNQPNPTQPNLTERRQIYGRQ